MKGIDILENSLVKFPVEKRECLYYISIANYKLGKYGDARRVVKDLLVEEPNNKQFQSLLDLIDEKSRKGIILDIFINIRLFGRSCRCWWNYSSIFSNPYFLPSP